MKRQALNHTKMDMLMRILGVPRYVAVGILESLWHLTAREAPRGNIGRLSDERIAVGIDWRGAANRPRAQEATRLVHALTEAGWLDIDASERLIVHDWSEHADEGVKKYLKRNNLTFCVSRHIETYSASRAGTGIGSGTGSGIQTQEPQNPKEPESPLPPNVRQLRSAQRNTVALPPEFESFDFAAWFEAQWEKHPIPGRKQVAQQYAAERIFQPDGFLPDDFTRVHDAWCEYWASGESAPCKLEVFIADGWWRKMPPAAKARADPRKSAAASALDMFEL